MHREADKKNCKKAIEPIDLRVRAPSTLIYFKMFVYVCYARKRSQLSVKTHQITRTSQETFYNKF